MEARKKMRNSVCKLANLVEIGEYSSQEARKRGRFEYVRPDEGEI